VSAFLIVLLIIIGLAAVAAWVWSNEEYDHFKYDEDENFLTDQDVNDDGPRFL
jgi:uncharacterized ion transporter superfamily protein YfcC